MASSRGAGPSPFVPSLLVVVLGLVIFGPNTWLVIILLLALLIVQLLSTFSSISVIHDQSSSLAHDAEGFGFGTLLLILIYFVLYNLV
ncbi:hypothetical protein OWV82_009080 [Melia azedarach]|uniref:Uncharacterized protein n=1 Tax=Melia azedarach TaxID=155640 RepID=A0ACC1YD46_MELAZ|nr:hypothetical protein OWV82_009080 [Melia azedarach]